jgi:hypothetical protein
LYNFDAPFVGERYFWDAEIAVNGEIYEFWWVGDYNFVGPLPAPGDTVEPGQLPGERYYIDHAGFSNEYYDYYFGIDGMTITVVDEVGEAPEVPLPMSLPLLASGIAAMGWLSRRRANGL